MYTWTEIEIHARRYKLFRAYMAGVYTVLQKISEKQDIVAWNDELKQKMAEIQNTMSEMATDVNLEKSHFNKESDIGIRDLIHYLTVKEPADEGTTEDSDS